MHHLLGQRPYGEVEHAAIELPERQHRWDCLRNAASAEILVPEVY